MKIRFWKKTTIETEVNIDGHEFHLKDLSNLFLPYKKRPVEVLATQLNKDFEVKTLEGIMKGEIGDWLIIGVKGEPYPCKPDIFKETYEKVDLKKGRFKR